MAISPETKSRPSSATASVFDTAPKTVGSSKIGYNPTDKGSGNSMAYFVGVLALIIVGYFGYTYYWPTTSLPALTNQTSTTIAPSAVPAPTADGPAAKTTP